MYLSLVSGSLWLMMGLIANISLADARIPAEVQLYSSSLPPQKQKRQDIRLIPTDLALVSTLDGSIRGINRLDGDVFWTLPGGAEGSLIKSTMHAHSRAPPSSIFSYNAENLLEESFTENTQSTSIEDDVYYIVEPQNGGILYLYGNGKPLEKIPLSVKEIVTHSPWRTPDGTTYIGGKNTVMIAIDPRNGNILRKFDLDQSEEAYVMATQKKLPPHTIFLGRDEYRVAIFNNDNEKWWNVTYAEYVTNQLDTDVPASTPPMDVYLAPDADNAITAIHLPTGELMWTMPTGFPAVRVFDVYRRPDFTIALFEQEPPQTLDKGIMGDMLKLSQNNPGLTTAYVGLHYGGLYALSTDRFPLAQLSLWASLYTGIEPGKKQPLIGGPAANKRPASKCCKGCKNHAECLVGKHIIETPLLPAKPSPLGIMGPIVVEPAEPLSPGTKLYKEQKKGFFYDGPGMFWKSYLLALVIAAYVYRVQIERFSRAQVLPRWNRFVKKWNSRIKKYKASVAKSRELANDKDTEKQKDMSQETDKDMGAKVDELMAMVNALNKEAKETKKANEAKEANEKREKAEKEKKEKEKELLAIAIETSSPTGRSATMANGDATGLNLKSFTPTTTSVLTLSKTVLGYGSHGTVVYKGEFDGRSVAVKRLLIDFYDVALQEVKLLQESDDHANVIRYFYKEETDRFLFIALELCYGSLHDCMERSLPIADMQLFDQINPANILQQMMAGIQHLHSLKIVHRDIKPHNILLAPSKTNRKDKKPSLRILISDFGLCKKLDGEQSSFHYTAQSPAGTSGWRAPELLAGALHATASETSHSSKGGNDPNTIGSVKATRAIDIFSAGCVFYYVLSGGEHPFGNRFGRENNILKGVYDLSRLQSMGEDGVEAMDLIERMLSVQPHIRPKADIVLAHPFFWSPSKRLGFLQDASDRFEVEQRDPPSDLLRRLESDGERVIGQDWYRRIDRVLANDLGKFRKYDGKRVRDLLRALRNKKHHWQDLPDPVKKTLGEPPNDYLYYFTARFPYLLLHAYYVILNDPSLTSEGSLRQYF